jgi:hypothetical protein
MRRAVWLTLAIAVNAILSTISQGQTNSCISPTDGFWDEARIWSLHRPPSIKQSAILITNDASETVTIDSTTAKHFKSTLTISNLSISALSGSDTLYLDNTATTALHILNSLTIGISFNNFGNEDPGGGALISSNSALIVDGLEGGQLVDDGAMFFTDGSLITTNCSFQIAPESYAFSPPVGVLVVSNGAVQARDVTIGTASISQSGGTLELIGGIMTVSSSLDLGYGRGGGGGGHGNLLVANGGLLVVTNGYTGISSGTMTVSNASFLGNDVFLGDLMSIGELVINNGTVNLNGQLDIGTGDLSSGSVFLNGGLLVATNDVIAFGGDFTGGGDFTVSDGKFLGQAMFLFDSTLSIQGGLSILSSNLDISFGSSVYISGGQLFVTNAPMAIFGGDSQCIVTGGQLTATIIELSPYAGGTLTVNGGFVNALTGLTIGNCASNVFGHVSVDGGQLTVTNAAHTGFIDVQNGKLVLSSGLLEVDKLVMTNTCSSFIHTGGTLIVGSVILDPNAFAITSVAREGNDLLITWLMAPGATNALQVSSGGKHGAYATKGFTDIFVVTNNTTAGTLTNYLDVGAATNTASRYYRARLAP